MPIQIGFVFAPPVRYIMCKLMLTDFCFASVWQTLLSTFAGHLS